MYYSQNHVFKLKEKCLTKDCHNTGSSNTELIVILFSGI